MAVAMADLSALTKQDLAEMEKRLTKRLLASLPHSMTVGTGVVTGSKNA